MPQRVVRAAGYIRVSDLKQEKNYSPKFQRDKILEYCRLQGISIREEHIFVDTYTGKVWRQRKGLQQVLTAAKRHEFDVLVMYKLDRFSRDRNDQIIVREQLQYYGVKTVTLDPEEHADDDSIAGEIIRAVYGWKAELERKDIIQRTQDGLRQRVKEGKLLPGRRPLYGYAWNDEEKKEVYVIDIEEAQVVIRIFTWAKEGVSLRQIAFRLTADGIVTPGGKTLWRYQTVKNILANPFYIGKAAVYKTKSEFIPGEGEKKSFRPEEEWVYLPEGTVPPIIDVETFEAVQKQLILNKKYSARNNPSPQDTLLRCGMAVCGSCGHNLAVDRSRYRGKTRTRYRCPRAHKGYGECSGAPDIAAAILDSLVWKHAVEIIRDPSALQCELEKQKTTDPTKDELQTLENLLADVITRIKNLTETIERTADPDAQDILTHRLSELASQKTAFEEKRDTLLREKVNWQDVQKALNDFKQWCVRVRGKLDNAVYEPTYEEKRNALERLGICVLVYPVDQTPQVKIVTTPAELSPHLHPCFVAPHRTADIEQCLTPFSRIVAS